MKPTLREPREYFNANVPDELQKACRQLIFEACQNSENGVVAEGYDYEVQHDHYPYERRSKIEQYCGQLSRYPGVTIQRNSNSKHTAYHTLVRIGNVILTVSKVSSPSKLPRIAKFRNELAGAQSSFTVTSSNRVKINRPVYPRKKILYAIIIYGTHKTKPSVPTFIDVIFPDKSYASILDRINLYVKYPDIQSETITKDKIKTEKIGDNVVPKLKDVVPMQTRLFND